MWSLAATLVVVVAWAFYLRQIYVSQRKIGVTAVVTGVERDEAGKLIATTYEYQVGRSRHSYTNRFVHDVGETVALRIDPKTKKVKAGEPQAEQQQLILVAVMLILLTVGVLYWLGSDLGLV